MTSNLTLNSRALNGTRALERGKENLCQHKRANANERAIGKENRKPMMMTIQWAKAKVKEANRLSSFLSQTNKFAGHILSAHMVNPPILQAQAQRPHHGANHGSS